MRFSSHAARRRRLTAALLSAACATASFMAAGGTAGASQAAARPGLASPPPAWPGFRPPAVSPLAARYSMLAPGTRAVSPRVAASSSAAGHGALVRLGGIASPPAINGKTHTIYVPLQSSDIVDVINTATCNLRVHRGCRVLARAKVGRFGPAGGPLYAVVDPRTNTLYVINASPHAAGSVTVVDAARCDAADTRGCGRLVATIRVGKFPVAAAFSARTGTLYVANVGGNSISVIDAAGCNAVTRRACGRTPRTLHDPGGPDWLSLANATGTLYAANAGLSGNGNTVSVYNAATCDAATHTGCGQVPRNVTVGSGPFGVAVDQSTGAVYVANNNDGTISVINGAKCNASHHTGCAHAPRTVTTGLGTGYVAVDPALHTAFSISGSDDTISEINTRTCDGRADSGCPATARNEHADYTAPFGGNPNAFALVPGTSTAYLVSVGGGTVMSAVSVARCNATRTAGCRVLPPVVPDHEFLLAADPATGTLYAGNDKFPRIDVIDAASCDASHLTGCKPVAEIPMADPQANMSAGSIDPATRTLYASDPFSDTVSVISTAACNAHHTSGCSATPPTITIGKGPGPPAFDKATKTLYVPFGVKSNKIAVVNAATCNATDTTGCTQTPAVTPVGVGTFFIAVSAATNTVYAPATGYTGKGRGHTVAVINGRTCKGTDHTGCAHPAATADVGRNPLGITIDDKTRTVYVANFNNSDYPGTVSMINEATCDGTHTAGCAARHPFVTVAPGPYLLTVDTRTGMVYVPSDSWADVSLFNAATCNATRTSGCRSSLRELPAGSGPVDAAILGSTLYLTLAFHFPNVSMAVLKIKS